MAKRNILRGGGLRLAILVLALVSSISLTISQPITASADQSVFVCTWNEKGGPNDYLPHNESDCTSKHPMDDYDYCTRDVNKDIHYDTVTHEPIYSITFTAITCYKRGSSGGGETIPPTPSKSDATLKFDANKGQDAPEPLKQSGTDGSYEFTIPTKEPTRKHYHFDGWSLDSKATKGTYRATNPEADTIDVEYGQTKTLFAVWKNTPPSLYGVKDVTIPANDPTFTPMLGVTANDVEDGDGITGDYTKAVKWSGHFDISKPGTYVLTYTVKDGAGASATLTRKVTVVDRQLHSMPSTGMKDSYLTMTAILVLMFGGLLARRLRFLD